MNGGKAMICGKRHIPEVAVEARIHATRSLGNNGVSRVWLALFEAGL